MAEALSWTAIVKAMNTWLYENQLDRGELEFTTKATKTKLVITIESPTDSK